MSPSSANPSPAPTLVASLHPDFASRMGAIVAVYNLDIPSGRMKAEAMSEIGQRVYLDTMGCLRGTNFVLREQFVNDYNMGRFDFYGERLDGVDLSEVKVPGVCLHDTSMIKTNLSGANFISSNVKGSLLYEANLHDAIFRGALLYGVGLCDSDLIGSDFSKADLYLCSMRNAQLQDANFRGAKLRQVDLYNANLRRTDFSDTNLYGVDFGKADLYRTDFRDATFLLCRFSGAKVKGMIFDNGMVNKVDIDLDREILAKAEQGLLDMGHSDCGPAYCRARWAIVLTGNQELEERFGTNAAASLIYAAAGHDVIPEWGATHDETIADMRQRIETQKLRDQ